MVFISFNSWSTPVEKMQIAENSAADRVEVPTDGASEWEIDVKLLKFGNKVASGSYGDLYRGTYCSQDVAIKVLKPERINADMQREFAQQALCRGYPTKFASYFHYCRSLRFEDAPDYQYLKRLFRDLFIREDIEGALKDIEEPLRDIEETLIATEGALMAIE
ncbi:hypothetical protein ZEAMMB73_Zm00001d047686 [Zea mays]|uniref:Protein kinase domain-containing protein n=1 Tax=Zea mays TaxID=4577 RepID=A0A1D6PCE8_MAIZE|nr:hypothetical protein ZEAMMB73_Zm00001d047686 [Zea mays]